MGPSFIHRVVHRLSTLILLHQRVLGLGQDELERGLVEILKRRYDRKAADEFRDQAVFEQVFRLDVAEDLALLSILGERSSSAMGGGQDGVGPRSRVVSQWIAVAPQCFPPKRTRSLRTGRPRALAGSRTTIAQEALATEGSAVASKGSQTPAVVPAIRDWNPQALDALFGVVQDATANPEARRKAALKIAEFLLPKAGKKAKVIPDEYGFSINPNLASAYRDIQLELRALVNEPTRVPAIRDWTPQALDALFGVVQDATANPKARSKAALKIAEFLLPKAGKKAKVIPDEYGFSINPNLAGAYRDIRLELRALQSTRKIPAIAAKIKKLEARSDAIIRRLQVPYPTKFGEREAANDFERKFLDGPRRREAATVPTRTASNTMFNFKPWAFLTRAVKPRAHRLPGTNRGRKDVDALLSN